MGGCFYCAMDNTRFERFEDKRKTNEGGNKDDCYKKAIILEQKM